MDEYCKTAPRTSSGEKNQRERENVSKSARVLQASSEESFRAILWEEFSVGEGHPKYDAMLTLWRQQHPRR
jgi:hypothetical protein